MTADEVDWWSKYYASTGETEKCKKYLESSGCYKIKVLAFTSVQQDMIVQLCMAVNSVTRCIDVQLIMSHVLF